MTSAALALLPFHLRTRLADALDRGLLDETPSAASLRSVLGDVDAAKTVPSILAELRKLGMNAAAIAAWLRGLAQVQASAPRMDLVWTGPPVAGLHARDTRRVYAELLGSATRTLWITTFAFFDGASVFEIVAKRMDKIQDLQVTLLLNIQRKHGDTTAPDHLVAAFAQRFWKQEWPGTRRPRVLYDPRSLDLPSPGGVLHAKSVVADDETVFVTSANLTDAALDRNIELGLLLRDRAMAGSIVAHFRGMIDRGMLKVLPG
jgi:phosphatidylserine/phosphatidylglycerophosphate/cardiolipin synthase-like enzyme